MMFFIEFHGSKDRRDNLVGNADHSLITSRSEISKAVGRLTGITMNSSQRLPILLQDWLF